MTQNTTFRNRFLGKIMDSLYNWWMAGTLTLGGIAGVLYHKNKWSWLVGNIRIRWHEWIARYPNTLKIINGYEKFAFAQFYQRDVVILYCIISRNVQSREFVHQSFAFSHREQHCSGNEGLDDVLTGTRSSIGKSAIPKMAFGIVCSSLGPEAL